MILADFDPGVGLFQGGWQFSAQQSPAPASIATPITAAGSRWPSDISTNGLNGQSESHTDDDRQHGNPVALDASRVYYDKRGIVGAGTSLRAMTLTLPLDKPLDKDAPIETFSASELLDYVRAHLVSQGVREPRVHGYAFGPPANGQLIAEHEDFTYG
jgi:hypothetical protein